MADRPGIVRRAANRARFSRHAVVRRGFRVAWAGVRRGRILLGTSWHSATTKVWWDGDDLLIRGWGFTRGVDYGAEPQISLWLENRGTKVYAHIERHPDPEIRTAIRNAEFDYASTGFEARLDAATLAALGTSAAVWQAKISIVGDDAAGAARSSGPLHEGRTSTYLPRLRRQTSKTLIGPVRDDSGIGVCVAPAGVSATRVLARKHSIWIGVPAGITGGELRGMDGTTVPLRNVPTAGHGWLRASPAASGVASELPEIWRAWVHTSDGPRPIVLDEDVRPPGTARRLWVRSGQDQSLEIVDAAGLAKVNDVAAGEDSAGPYVQFSGVIYGDYRQLEFSLHGASNRIIADATVHDDGTFAAKASLVQSRWDGPLLPVPRGPYVLRGRAGTQRLAVFVAEATAAQLPEQQQFTPMTVRCDVDAPGQLRVRVRRPFAADEFGSINQTRLAAEYGDQALEPLDAIVFESFFGRNATCNPLAIDRLIARRYPDLARYWSITDYSVPVPDGATPLLVGSRQWWRVRESARWIVTNEWMGEQFVKKSYQTVLQTWHGSMYKRIGLDRGERGAVHQHIVRRERGVWDLFVSQSAETTPIIERAYDFAGGVIETGYPRNDDLHQIDAERIARIKERIGVATDTVVVMYAPTWRESSQDTQLLDLPRARRQLGAGFTFLQRGHVRTASIGVADNEPGVIDVSDYPHINDLYAIADVLITDYSSMMFDFSVTGKPMIFFTPDLDEYADPRVRGVYFELAEIAPGPVVDEPGQVLELLRERDSWPAEYCSRYAAWQQRFNHLDDGHATERVVDALMNYSPTGAGAGYYDEPDPPGLGKQVNTDD